LTRTEHLAPSPRRRVLPDNVSNDDHNGDNDGDGGGGCNTATAVGIETDKSTIN
jgi:hypothetical protein